MKSASYNVSIMDLYLLVKYKYMGRFAHYIFAVRLVYFNFITFQTWLTSVGKQKFLILNNFGTTSKCDTNMLQHAPYLSGT